MGASMPPLRQGRPRLGFAGDAAEEAARLRQNPFWGALERRAMALLCSEDDSPAMLGDTIGLGGLVALVTGDRGVAEGVERALAKLSRLVDAGAYEPESDLDHAWRLAAMAFGYDWAYAAMRPSARREGARLLMALARVARERYPVLFHPATLDAFNNHAIWSHAAVSAAALAAAGEAPEALALAEQSHALAEQCFLPVFERFVGAEGIWNEGTHYNIESGKAMFAWMSALGPALGRDYFAAAWVRAYAYCWIYLTRADDTMTILGDWWTDRGEETIGHLMARSFLVTARAAAAHRDEHLQAFTRRQIAYALREPVEIWHLLWYDPSLAARPVEELPPSRLFQGDPAVNGGEKLAVLRSGWGAEARTITLSMGDWLSHHDHYDTNSFTIHYRDDLALDPGYSGDLESFRWLLRGYEQLQRLVPGRRGAVPAHQMGARHAGGLRREGAAHGVRRFGVWARSAARKLFRGQEERSWTFYRRTCAHNTLLVPVPEDQAVRDAPALRDLGWGYDGGQRVPIAEHRLRTMDRFFALRNPEHPERSLFETGSCLLFEAGEARDYVVGDATPAYYRSQLTRFVRHLVFLKPDVVVLYDVVETPPGRAPRWLLQSVHAPTLHESGLVVRNGGGELRVRTLLPEQAEVVVHRTPGMAIYDVPGTGVPRYRTEIIAPSGSEHRFLHVLHITDEGSTDWVDSAWTREGAWLSVTAQAVSRTMRVALRWDGEPGLRDG